MKHHGRGMQRHNELVLGGEYDIPGLDLPENALVLDIGACDGAFTLWALKRWPTCIVHAYEPNPQACLNWIANVLPIARGRARLHTVAVHRNLQSHLRLNTLMRRRSTAALDLWRELVPCAGAETSFVGTACKAQLWPGPNNQGEASTTNRWGTHADPILVPAIDPATLPHSAFAKIDTEGAEVEIITNMPRPTHGIGLEWHSKEDANAIAAHFELLASSEPTKTDSVESIEIVGFKGLPDPGMQTIARLEEYSANTGTFVIRLVSE